MTEEREKKWEEYVEYMDSLTAGDVVFMFKDKELMEYVGFVNGEYVFKHAYNSFAKLFSYEIGDLEDEVDISLSPRNKLYVSAAGKAVELNEHVLHVFLCLLGLKDVEYTPFTNETVLEWGNHYQVGTIGNQHGNVSIYCNGKLTDLVIARVKDLLAGYKVIYES